jgi:hypothetical protein
MIPKRFPSAKEYALVVYLLRAKDSVTAHQVRDGVEECHNAYVDENACAKVF